MAGVPDRRSIRLRGFDYRSAGAYFVTVVAWDRRCLFGEIVEERVSLSRIGEVVARLWRDIPRHFSHVHLDAFVVMPNHLHGILVLQGRGTACRAPTEAFGRPIAGSLSTITRSFKSASTRLVNLERGTPGASFWQRGYYERIVRDDDNLNRLRRYIEENPLRWALDEENPNRLA